MTDWDPGFTRLEHAWRIYVNAQEMIKYADQKVQVLIGLGTLVIGVVVARLQSLAAFTELGVLTLLGFGLCSVLFFVFALAALLARSDKSTPRDAPRLIYFGHIASRSTVEYSAAFRDVSHPEALDDLCYQVVEVGTIAAKKFRYYRHAWKALGAVAGFALVFLISS